MALELLFNEWEDTIINLSLDIRQDVTQLQDGIQLSTRKLRSIPPVAVNGVPPIDFIEIEDFTMLMMIPVDYHQIAETAIR